MKSHASASKANQKTSESPSQQSSPGESVVAISPPGYGIEFVDQGLPEQLRAGIESLSGMDMSDVQVHANSAKPAQVGALAYAQRNDIHLAPGQERQLPHEAWHVVQQRQGRVRPTLSARGVRINDDAQLEKEADAMGQRASQLRWENAQATGNTGLSDGRGKSRLTASAPDRVDRQTVSLQRKPADPGKAAEAPSVAVTSLEEAVKNLPKLPADQAVAVLKRFQQFIIGRISMGEGRIRLLMSLRAESFSNYLIGGAIEVFGGTSLPSGNWEEPWRHVTAAYATIGKRQVKESLDHLVAAAAATSRHWSKLNEYLEQTEKGADRSIFALQVLQAAGAVAATALTGGGAAAIVVGAGYGAAQNLAGQATAVSIGIQDRIDWGGLAFDTLFGVLTGALGGRLGNAVLKKLLGNKAVASLGRRVLAEAVSDLVSGRLSSILQTSARSLFDQLRGRENLTMEQFVERLAEQLMDPKAMFLDAIMGRASRMAHAPSSKAPKKTTAATHVPAAEPPAKTTTTPHVPAAEPPAKTTTTPHVPAAEPPAKTTTTPAEPAHPAVAPEPKAQGPTEPKGLHEPPAPAPAKSEQTPAGAKPGPGDQADIGRGAGLTRSQTAAAGKLIGKPLTAGDNILGSIWEGVSNPGEKSKLTKSNSRRLFNNQRKRFWNAVFDDQAARALLEKAGCRFDKRGNAPILELPDGKRLQMTIDHATERQQDPSKALDASNLRLSPRRENTVVLRQLHDQDPFQDPARHGWTPY